MDIRENVSKEKNMNSKKVIRIIAFVIADIVTVIISEILPLALRFGIFDIADHPYFWTAIKWLPVDIVVAVIVLAIFKLYNRVWSFASIDELLSILKASIIIELVYVAYKVIFRIAMPRSFFVFNWVFLFLLVCASRLAIRLFKRIRRRFSKEPYSKNVMIIGAGSAGATLIDEFQMRSDSTKVSCIIDDNSAKKGKYIRGIPIVGGRDQIVDAADRYSIDEIIIAIPSAEPLEIRELIEICQQTNAKVKRMPAIAATLNASISQTIRDVNYEDLLGRKQVTIENPALASFIAGKTVMVTGGGGTIGSELCRQLIANKPKTLLIVDIYENGAYELQMELNQYYPERDVKVLIASVRDYDRMEDIFRQYRPDIIYHAAAHKHVPLMEVSPNEAVKNNCGGTLNMVKLADKYNVKRFVLISTDKAVRPTNVMGATKRICEMIVQTYNRMSETEYVAVRFGNVLGSNGSVIPLFMKQIEAGGPVTLTHREITRFFMTIPEAVSLVLESGIMANGGEIFVLDMGEPVKIYDLAVNLIKMKGYVPEKDIRIEIVGLRPGEKLYEELLMAEEGLQETENELIHIGKPIKMDSETFMENLNRLISIAEDNSMEIKSELSKVCDTYTPQNN